MKAKIIVPILFLVIAAVLWVVNHGGDKKFDTVAPKTMPAVQAVYATGTVEASAMISISPKVAARLMSLDVDEGSKVVKGQVLAQLEDTDLQQNLTELQAQLELADKNLKRAQTLGKSGAVSKQALDDARTTHTAAQAAVDRSKAELSYLQLLAPENGTIIRRDGEIGELITPTTALQAGNPVFWMNGGDKIRIATEVDEEDIGLVEVGQRVVVSADAFPGQIFEGKVQSITPKGDPVARSYRVRVTLNDQTPLMIGMTAETNIITQQKDAALMIPATAVKGDSVWVVKGHTPALTKIREGIVTDTMVEVLEGVGENDKVAVRYDDVAKDEDARKKAVCNMGTGC